MNMSIAYMEPLLPSGPQQKLEDLAFDLTAQANAFSGKVNPIVAHSMSNLVRSMNCYYSNLIEGHDTHPIEIDRALQNNYSEEPKKRALQREALAHITVQKMIDDGKAISSNPLSMDYAIWVHEQFCVRLPEELLWVENPKTKKKIKLSPGVLRNGLVQVGRHVPPTHTDLPSFLKRFEDAYNFKKLTKCQSIIAVAASHHRMLWIHPFYDGNGRVVRLMSYAALKELKIGNNLWSVARGLARNKEDYKSLLAAADSIKRGDLDGRGTLSQAALVRFCEFFLEVCIDQVHYMSGLLDFETLLRRIQQYTNDQVAQNKLPKKSFLLLREALIAGEFERGKAAEITGFSERAARDILKTLLEKGLLVSDNQRGPVRLGFPLKIVEHWFPHLYPARIKEPLIT